MNGFLEKIARAKKQAEQEARLFACQMDADMIEITLHDNFGFGAERVRSFMMAYMKNHEDYAQLFVDDYNANVGKNKDIAYAKEKLDNAVKRATGKYFVPYDERYGV